MQAYADESELLLYVGGLFERVLSSPELGSRLAGTGVVLHHVCHDPSASLVLDLPGRRVHAGSHSPVAPNASLALSASDANRYWQGALNLTAALADGSARVGGAITRLLRAGPNPQELREHYRDVLRAHGRQDLLV
jgi:hypothetical protein